MHSKLISFAANSYVVYGVNISTQVHTRIAEQLIVVSYTQQYHTLCEELRFFFFKLIM